MQTTSHILMIRPVHFTFNAQTATNNAFQVPGKDLRAQELALQEFDDFVTLLRGSGVDVIVIDDSPEPHTPDSIFPNNWISFHTDGTIVLYPMYALNRRLERKPAVLETIGKKFTIRRTIDLSGFESSDQFLEGTGSMVLDRDKKIAFACLSPRTDESLFKDFCRQLNYHPVIFDAVDMNGGQIYHTNVMMCVGDRYVVICMESIPDPSQEQQVREVVREAGKELIEISLTQMNRFAGNMLQVCDAGGDPKLVMSTQAYRSLDDAQIRNLETFNPIIHAPLEAIETNGGGSARCMMAEIHLPIRK